MKEHRFCVIAHVGEKYKRFFSVAPNIFGYCNFIQITSLGEASHQNYSSAQSAILTDILGGRGKFRV